MSLIRGSNPELIESVKALDGRLVRTLTNDENILLTLYRNQGRKWGIQVKISSRVSVKVTKIETYDKWDSCEESSFAYEMVKTSQWDIERFNKWFEHAKMIVERDCNANESL